MSYELNHAFTECPNEDCWYTGDLEEFTDEELEDEVYGDGVNEIKLKCPKCGQEWTAAIEAVIDYKVENIK